MSDERTGEKIILKPGDPVSVHGTVRETDNPKRYSVELDNGYFIHINKSHLHLRRSRNISYDDLQSTLASVTKERDARIAVLEADMEAWKADSSKWEQYALGLEKQLAEAKWNEQSSASAYAGIRERAERVLSYFEEFTLEPYKDSDPLSLLYTLRARAKEAFRIWREGEITPVSSKGDRDE